MAKRNLDKEKLKKTKNTTAWKLIAWGIIVSENFNPHFWNRMYLVKIQLLLLFVNVSIVKQTLLYRKHFLQILLSEVLEGVYFLLINDPHGYNFHAVVVLVLFRFHFYSVM